MRLIIAIIHIWGNNSALHGVTVSLVNLLLKVGNSFFHFNVLRTEWVARVTSIRTGLNLWSRILGLIILRVTILGLAVSIVSIVHGISNGV